jgi:hypothetical protein
MFDVVAMGPSGGAVAPGKRTSAISVDECSAHAQGYGAVRAADVQRFGFRAQYHGYEFAVAGEHAGMCGTDETPGVEQGSAEFGFQHV